MEPDGTFLLLGVCVFTLSALVAAVRCFRLLPEHVEQRRVRDELRRRLVKKRVITVDTVLYELDETGKISEKPTQVS